MNEFSFFFVFRLLLNLNIYKNSSFSLAFIHSSYAEKSKDKKINVEWVRVENHFNLNIISFFIIIELLPGVSIHYSSSSFLNFIKIIIKCWSFCVKCKVWEIKSPAIHTILFLIFGKINSLFNIFFRPLISTIVIHPSVEFHIEFSN